MVTLLGVSIRSRYIITSDAERVANIVTELGADGVDLTQNEGYGDSMMVNNDETSSQLMFLHHLRQSLSADKIISYTFPVDQSGPGAGQGINFPYRDYSIWSRICGYIQCLSSRLQSNERNDGRF